MMIKGILLDIDNTLYDYEKTHNIAIHDVCRKTKTLFNEEDFYDLYKSAKTKVKDHLKDVASAHNRLLYFQKMLELAHIGHYLYAKEMYDVYWASFLDNLILFDGVPDFLASCQKSKICFVTDLTAYIQYRKIEKLNLNQYVKYIVTSEEAGKEKPDPVIFKLALQKLDLKSEDVCMIGDSYEKDIIGALNLNIKPFWKTLQKSENKDITVFNDFNTLKDMLR